VTVYVDDFRRDAVVRGSRGRWSHLLADEEAELHSFAARLGLRREWFQDPRVGQPGRAAVPRDSLAGEFWHYDVTEAVRQRAIRAGAVEIRWRDAPEIGRRRVVRRLGAGS
jgi:hypothetical protein